MTENEIATVANVARIYDYLLDGKDNFLIDRRAAEKLLELVPETKFICHENRRFLQRAVRFLVAEAGIRQFIDIGTGLPTRGNVHEVAHEIAPDARIAYVDYDPVVITHAKVHLANESTVLAIPGDLRMPGDILAHPDIQRLIHFGKPLAIFLVAVLHFIKDDESPYDIVGTLKDAMPPGSYLVASHVSADEVEPDVTREAQRVYEKATATVTPRSLPEIEQFFDGLELLDPGVTNISTWRTAQMPHSLTRVLGYGGVGKKL